MKKHYKKVNKYRNQKVIVDGIKFDSTKESRRYLELNWLKKAGKITDFDLQPVFEFKFNGVLVCKYKADFRVYYPDGTVIIEDVKSEITKKDPVYRIKNKLMKAVYNIEITEI